MTILIDILVQVAGYEQERRAFLADGRAESHPAALPEIEADLARLAHMLPDRYGRRLRRRWSRGDAATAIIIAGACEICHGKVPAADAPVVERGKAVVTCTHCGRFLVHRPWS